MEDEMRRAMAILSATVLLLVGGIWVVAAADPSNGTSDRSMAQVSGTIRATRFYQAGPSAKYDFDYGSIGTVSALRRTLPAGATYDVVVTLSMDYRTSPTDRFIVGLLVRLDAEYGHRVSTEPSVRAIAASTVRTSTTAVFRPSDIRGGHEYWFTPTVNVSHRVGDRAWIGAKHVVLVVDVKPSA
jgi:hypothetical protein